MIGINIKELIEFSLFIIGLIQALLFSMVILTLRSSLLNFYKSNSKIFNEFHPQILHPQTKEYSILSKLGLKIFIFGNFNIFEKKYLKLCSTNDELIRSIDNIPAHLGVEDKVLNPYYFLAVYNMRKCLKFALWSFIFIIFFSILKTIYWYFSSFHKIDFNNFFLWF